MYSINNRTFIYLRPTPWALQALYSFCLNNNIQMIKSDELHCTIICSKNYINCINKTNSDVIYRGYNFYFNIWKDIKNRDILVLTFDSEKLHNRHKELISKYNLVHQFDEYRPHITISSDLKNIKDIDLDDLNYQIEEYIYRLDLISETQE